MSSAEPTDPSTLESSTVHEPFDLFARALKCSFLRLPAELRNRIYELVLRQNMSIRIDGNRSIIDQPENFLAITEVCRQIHVESRSMLFAVNTFLVSFDFVFWLRGLEDYQRESITSIEFFWTLPIRLRNGVWSGAPVRHHDNYLGMVLRVLPGLRHINLDVTLVRGYSAGALPLEHDVRRCLETLKRSFQQSTTGVRVTSTTAFEGRVT